MTKHPKALPDSKGKRRPAQKPDQHPPVRRTKQMLLRMTPEELAAVDSKANRAGYSREAFARAALAGAPPLRAVRTPPVDHVTLRRIVGELGRIGNNVNQLARDMNRGNIPDVPEMRAAAQAVMDAADAILEALGKEPARDNQGQKPRRP